MWHLIRRSRLTWHTEALTMACNADGRKGWKVTDQLAFNLLLDRNIVPIHVRHYFSRLELHHGDPHSDHALQSLLRMLRNPISYTSLVWHSDTSTLVLQAPDDDKRVIWTYGDKLRLKPLPVLVAANGHVFFYQHLPEKCCSTCPILLSVAPCA